MKNIIKNLFFILIAASALVACEKDENRVVFEGGTNPVLTTSSTTAPLNFIDADKDAITLSWTNPEYSFNTGVSSMGVSYNLEIDTVGANFTNPKKQVIALSNDLSKTFKVSELNDILSNKMDLRVGMAHQIEARVTSTLSGISGNPTILTSNKVSFTATPYNPPPKIALPASGKLFITGGATPAGWMGGGDAEVASQQFRQVGPTLFEISSINLKGGDSYLFVPVYGDWGNKYGYTGAGNANNVDGDEFKAGGNDIKAPSTSGNYKIQVDFQKGTFNVIKL